MIVRYAFLCLILLITLPAIGVQAQQRKSNSTTKQRVEDIDDLPQNIVKINIPSLAVGTISLFYERVIGDHTSLQLGLNYTSIKSDWLLDVRYRGYSVTPEFRYYFTSSLAPRGIFVAPFARYRYSDVTGNITRDGQQLPANAKISAYGAGVMIGGQIVGRHISVDAFLGPSLNARSVKVQTPNVTEKEFPIPNILGVFGLRAGITVGYAF